MTILASARCRRSALFEEVQERIWNLRMYTRRSPSPTMGQRRTRSPSTTRPDRSIKLKEGLDFRATVADIVSNPKNIRITELVAQQLPTALDVKMGSKDRAIPCGSQAGVVSSIRTRPDLRRCPEALRHPMDRPPRTAKDPRINKFSRGDLPESGPSQSHPQEAFRRDDRSCMGDRAGGPKPTHELSVSKQTCRSEQVSKKIRSTAST